MQFLFSPAAALMQRLRYAQKFTLLGVLALTAIALSQMSLLHALDRVIAPTRQEVLGLDSLMRLHRFTQLVEQYRAGAGAESAASATQAGLALHALAQSLPQTVAAAPRWQEVAGQWEALASHEMAWPLPLRLARSDDLLAKLLLLASDIADASALTLDPDIDSYYLMDALVRLPGFAEQLGRVRGGWPAAGGGDMPEMLGQVQASRLQYKIGLDKVMLYNPDVRERVARADGVFEEALRAAIDAARQDGGRADALAALSGNVYALGADILAPALRARLDARLLDARKSLQVSAAVSVSLALLFAYLAIGAFVALTRQIQGVLQGLRSLVQDSSQRAEQVETIAAGDLSREVLASTPLDLERLPRQRDEIGALVAAIGELGQAQQTLGRGFVRMTQTLRRHRDEERLQDWFKSGMNALHVELRGDRPLAAMAEAALGLLTLHVQGAVGALYLVEAPAAAGQEPLCLAAAHGLTPGAQARVRIAPGEGLAGTAARRRQHLLLTPVPPGYLPVASSLGQAAPAQVIALPLLHDDKLMGLVEIGSLAPFAPQHIEWLEQAGLVLAIALDVEQARRQVDQLLQQTQAQTEELRVQQEELQQSNTELEERADMLEQQREVIRLKNQESEAAGRSLRLKADELERTSAYKSEFLANMSHELRTPLNSMLILSSLLQQNKEGRLSPKQVEYAGTIHGAGKDLLNLINDILDLSKIEAGRLDFHIDELVVLDLAEQLRVLFEPLAEQQQLPFAIELAPGTVPLLHADGQRILQVLKNLLANAFKFTAQGSIRLSIRMGAPHEFALAGPTLAFAVADSGIGIAAEQHEAIFHAFRQADGSTSRNYGGTGLGLSISRQLARAMGGDIALTSAAGAGSAFTLYLPCAAMPAPAPARAAPVPAADSISAALALSDAGPHVPAGARTILIVEDDAAFAGILRDTVREHGFQALVAVDGESGLELALRHAPSAILLDVMLPHIDGWGVMRSLKDDPRTRHIPVHFITCLEDRQKALAMGAIGFATKPVSAEQLEAMFGALGTAIDKTLRKLLIVEDNEAEARSVAALLETGGLEITIARSGGAALALLAQQHFDCMVLDLGLPDMSGFDLLDRIARRGEPNRLPVVVHSGRDLSEADEARLRRYAESIIVKGAKSPDRLLGEVSLFLHLVESALPQHKQDMIRRALDKEAMFEQRKVLLVDDDIRNIFSLSSVLADKGMRIVEAADGREALAQLEAHADIDIVLMDIMMPEMDGYEAMRQIRKNPRHARLPIIGLTAKAMAGDQQLCLDAGASDYIVKPVDLDKLFSLMRVWLYRAAGAAQ